MLNVVQATNNTVSTWLFGSDFAELWMQFRSIDLSAPAAKVVGMGPLRLSFFMDEDQKVVHIRSEWHHTRGPRESGGLVEFVAPTSTDPCAVLLDLRLVESCAPEEIREAVCEAVDLSLVPLVVCCADASFLQSRYELLQELGCDFLAQPQDLEPLVRAIEHVLQEEEDLRALSRGNGLFTEASNAYLRRNNLFSSRYAN